jgi:hypothetical protein
MDTEGRWIDTWVAVEMGVPHDIGWGIVILNADRTVTRTCKGCGVSVTSRILGVTKVEPKPFEHADGCPMWPLLYMVQQG